MLAKSLSTSKKRLAGMVKPSVFRTYLESLNEDEYDALIQERIKRLNHEQQAIAQEREVQRHKRFELYKKLNDPDPDVRQHLFDILRDMDSHECEHGRHYVKHCLSCGEMDHLMFPELFDEDGFELDEN